MTSLTSHGAEATTTRETGYDVHFDPDPERKFLCPICLAVLRDPVQTMCGHRFCKKCLKRNCGNARFAKCPVDNTWFDYVKNTFDDVAMNREVLSLSVRCGHLPNGCQWRGELRDLQDHESECPEAVLDCHNGCGLRVRRQDIERHLAACPRRLEECIHCNMDVILADMTKHQLLTCSRFPVNCALCQKTGILREDIPDHVDLVNGDCPLVTVKCAFHHLGCYFQDKRKNMSTHYNASTQAHMLLMSARLAQQEEQLNIQGRKLRKALTACSQLTEMVSMHQQQLSENASLVLSHSSLLHDLRQTGCSGRLLWKIQLLEDAAVDASDTTSSMVVEREPAAGGTPPEVTDGNGRTFRSPSFYTGRPGYRLSLVLELAGHRDHLSDTYSSLFVDLERGDYDDDLCFPFDGVCHVTVRDQSEAPAHSGGARTHFSASIVCSRVPRRFNDPLTPINATSSSSSSGASGGCHQRGRLKFMRTADLLSNTFVHQGAIMLQVEAVHFPIQDTLSCL